MKCLTLLLFHNDDDIVQSQIDYYYGNQQDIIIFNHASLDNTHDIIMENINKIKHYYILDETISFKDNKVHETVCKIIKGIRIDTKPILFDGIQMTRRHIYNHSKKYDWISFPESDEFLEGPDRSKTWFQHLEDLHKTRYKGVQYLNFVFWFTSNDDINIVDPLERMKYYAFYENCGPRMYTWRAHLMPITYFGHTPPLTAEPDDIVKWKTRHYDCRSEDHFIKKMSNRKNVSIENQNSHYDRREKAYIDGQNFTLDSSLLHYDDGSDLIQDDKYDWSSFY